MQDYLQQISSERETTQKLNKEIQSFEISTKKKSTKLENKYQAEILRITSDFEAFKKQSQQSLQALKQDKSSLDT